MGTAVTACPACGTQVPAGDTFCGGCGNRAVPSWGPPESAHARRCPACGGTIDDLDTFCGSCGSSAPLAGARKASAAPVTPVAIPTAKPAGATIQRDATIMRATPAAAAASAPSASSATGRSSKGASAVVAVASAVAVVAISVVVLALLAGAPSQDSSDEAAAATVASTSTAAPVTTPTPAAPPTTAPAPPPTAPAGTGVPTRPGSASARAYEEEAYGGGPSYFWSVIVESKRSRSDAEAVAARLSSMGYDAEIDSSSNYRSLKPGYYVVHIGTYPDESSAYAAQEQIRPRVATAGYGEAYRRCFGDMPPCRANDPSIGS